MGHVYNVTVAGSAVSAAQDLFEVVAPADAIVRIRGLEIAQSTEAGDAADEMLGVSIITGHATSGSGGSSATPAPTELGSPAFGGTAEIVNTTIASTGTAVTHRASAFNVRAGYVWFPPESEMIILSPSARVVVRLTAPADSVTFYATFTIEEIGG